MAAALECDIWMEMESEREAENHKSAMTLFYLNFLLHAAAKASEPPRHCQALSAAHEDQVVGWTRS